MAVQTAAGSGDRRQQETACHSLPPGRSHLSPKGSRPSPNSPTSLGTSVQEHETMEDVFQANYSATQSLVGCMQAFRKRSKGAILKPETSVYDLSTTSYAEGTAPRHCNQEHGRQGTWELFPELALKLPFGIDSPFN